MCPDLPDLESGVRTVVLGASTFALACAFLAGCSSGPPPRISYECPQSSGQQFDSIEAAREVRSIDCTAYVQRPVTAAENAAAVEAYGRSADDDDVDALYGICADAGPATWEYLAHALAVQAREVRGALTLCPDHPDRALIERLLASS